MRVEVTPFRTTVVPGHPLALTITVFNTADIISAHRVRILGVDDRWVELDKDELALFPESSGTVTATITLPKGIPAGTRRLAVQVRETTPPARTSITEVELTVPADRGTRIELDPMSAQGGHAIDIAVRLANLGNTALTLHLEGIDPEDRIGFRFQPQQVLLAPGEESTAQARISHRRPFAGSPKPRQFSIQASGGETPVEAVGAFIQKPLLSRGALAMLGLIAAITVFAAVITITFGRVVDKNASDRDALLQVIQGNRNAGAAAAGSVNGKVSLLTSGTGVGAVTVEAFTSADTSKPVGSTATKNDGTYDLEGLDAGTYKLRFSGAGFTQLWYPTAVDPGNATDVQVQAGQPTANVNVRIGGVPASVAGKVIGTDPTGALVAIRVPGGAAPTLASIAGPNTPGSATNTGGTSSSPSAPTTTPNANAPPSSTASTVGAASAGAAQPFDQASPPAPAPGANPDAGAVVETVPVDATGTFTLQNVPSPSTYEIVVLKSGYAPAVQNISLQAGEQRTGIEIELQRGDGAIAGTITANGVPVGGATITASNSQTSIATVSLTQDSVGSFTLRDLPTPATYTVVITANGFATQTLSLALSQAQTLTGINVDLARASGSISGTVTQVGGGPIGGVTVTVANGAINLQTVSVSVGAVGTYRVDGLPLPGTYTVTFSRPDLTSQTRSVPLDALGTTDATGVNASLAPATAVLQGAITDSSTNAPLGEVQISASTGTSTFTTTSASSPPGQYLLAGLPPGTYTLSFSRNGSVPTNQLVTLRANQTLTLNVALAPQTKVAGVVLYKPPGQNVGTAVTGARVVIYPAATYPNNAVQTVQSGAGGAFTFVGINPGDYIVEVTYPPGGAANYTQMLHLTDPITVSDDPSANACGPASNVGAHVCQLNPITVGPTS